MAFGKAFVVASLVIAVFFLGIYQLAPKTPQQSTSAPLGNGSAPASASAGGAASNDSTNAAVTGRTGAANATAPAGG